MRYKNQPGVEAHKYHHLLGKNIVYLIVWIIERKAIKK